jgi:hypothetical protein
MGQLCTKPDDLTRISRTAPEMGQSSSKALAAKKQEAREEAPAAPADATDAKAAAEKAQAVAVAEALPAAAHTIPAAAAAKQRSIKAAPQVTFPAPSKQTTPALAEAAEEGTAAEAPVP